MGGYRRASPILIKNRQFAIDYCAQSNHAHKRKVLFEDRPKEVQYFHQIPKEFVPIGICRLATLPTGGIKIDIFSDPFTHLSNFRLFQRL